MSTGTESIEELITQLNTLIDQDERAMRWTTDRGTWEHVRNYAQSDRGQIRHVFTGDYLGSMTHSADAEHAVLWQPRRVRAEIEAKRHAIKAIKALSPTADERLLTELRGMLLSMIEVYASRAETESIKESQS